MRILAKGFFKSKRNFKLPVKKLSNAVMIKTGIAAATVIALLGIVMGNYEKTLPVENEMGSNHSTLVNGRNLPIYCVETEQKVVAISFDAAWADCFL